jgi:hypothetical protein
MKNLNAVSLIGQGLRISLQQADLSANQTRSVSVDANNTLSLTKNLKKDILDEIHK